MKRLVSSLVCIAALGAGVAAFSSQGVSQGAPQGVEQSARLLGLDPQTDTTRLREEIRRAQRSGSEARQRAEKLETRANQVTQEAERTAREAAALAARIQETDAAISGKRAEIALIGKQRADLRERIAKQQGPLSRLMGSLQHIARRPPLLALLRSGSVQDVVYMRALIDSMQPEVEKRTASLRKELDRGRTLERQANVATVELGKAKVEMRKRRQQLALVESRQRIVSHEATGIASRERDRALALAEETRDLSSLVQEMGKQGRLREQLGALSGPIMRPLRPEEARVADSSLFVAPPQGLNTYILPVQGRLVTGFGEMATGQARSSGLVLATSDGAQAVAPAPGRVAFAGQYRGYNQIVIIEHSDGWTSLVTGLVRLNVQVGANLIAGSPIGRAGPQRPQISVELRRDGVPVNPLQFIKSF